MMAVLLFDFLPGLPEEQVRADRSAQDRHYCRRVGRIPLYFRDNQGCKCPAPGNSSHCDHPDIGEKGEGRPFEDRRVARIAQRHLERSEEHTSELQSLMRISYAVFCLKKKTNNIHRTT